MFARLKGSQGFPIAHSLFIDRRFPNVKGNFSQWAKYIQVGENTRNAGGQNIFSECCDFS